MKKILFVCIENACRSQMAEAFARLHGQGKVAVFSAGSQPASEINPLAVEVMREKGIDISGKKPKSFSDLTEKNFDVVVEMGCEDACPFVPAGERVEWDIPDPKGQPLDGFRNVRDEIETKVKKLLEKIA
jgi:protein-tyrosine-phosphatase